VRAKRKKRQACVSTVEVSGVVFVFVIGLRLPKKKLKKLGYGEMPRRVMQGRIEFGDGRLV